MKPAVLMLSAERPYPLHGGGAYRTASLLHYFAQFADIDLILLAEDDIPAPVPEGLLRSQTVITLPAHSKSPAARYLRNARRALHGIPPLIDRLANLESSISKAIAGRRYAVAIVDHFWCAPYLELIQKHACHTVLNLHNIESMLHRSCAKIDSPLVALGQFRFARASQQLEKKILPRYSNILVTSQQDADHVRRIAPAANTTVYPNALPWMDVPHFPLKKTIVFAGNFEYHPNIDATKFLVSEIWPKVSAKHPEFKLRLVGRGEKHIRALLPSDDNNIEMTGPIPDTLPDVAAATVVVAPLRAGGGTRIKILESWAANRPVVATSLAAEGLATTTGQNILIADSAAAFAEAVCRCIEDAALQDRLAEAGRKTFETFYSWPKAWECLLSYNVLATRPEADGYTGLN